MFNELFNPLTARIFTVFGHSLLEDRASHKEAWVAKLLGTHLSIQVHKKVKFSWRNNSSLALKELRVKLNETKTSFLVRILEYLQCSICLKHVYNMVFNIISTGNKNCKFKLVRYRQCIFLEFSWYFGSSKLLFIKVLSYMN